jgi:hypothetical protein
MTTDNTGAVPEAVDDPDGLLDQLSGLHQSAAGYRLTGAVELYQRVSIIVRVTRHANAQQLDVQVGRDEGLAVRLLSGTSSGAGLAAVTGKSDRDLRWALEHAAASQGEGGGASPAWASPGEGPLIDRDPDLRVPAPAEAAGWMERLWEKLAPAGGQSAQPMKSWVEIAATIESWAADGGLHASRTRNRAWAVLQPLGTAGDRPVMIASRHWSDLKESGLQNLLADRTWPRERASSAVSGRHAVMFSPECSASLVLALVKALHNNPNKVGYSVGSAWKVADEPAQPGALFGSAFDDAGFPTQRRVLADGLKIRDVIAGEGAYRRPSFRDRPQPLPFNLVVATGGKKVPRNGLLVSSVTIHPCAAGDWIIEFSGGRLEDGVPGPPITSGFIRIAPGELVRRCVASFGEARQSYLGVQTPALLFDGLTVLQAS